MRAARRYLYSNNLKFVDSVAEGCYPIASDVAKIVVSHFHVSAHKVKIQSLGVDTNLFYPADSSFSNEDRVRLRTQLGLSGTSLVCVYTGRFARDKKAQCLARAINCLQSERENIQALFVGNGTEDEMEEIKAMKGCFIHKFVPVKELRKFYWISDIGVWPSQESTSQLDAAACGLPLVLSNRVEVVERVMGNGFLYEEDNETDLAMKIKLLKDHQIRHNMSNIGIAKVRTRYSWESIARERLKDYVTSLAPRSS
jgi:glycosyltransferase involved in cell wall biosynthesis